MNSTYFYIFGPKILFNRFHLVDALGGYLREIPEWFHLIRNGNGHIWVGALGVSEIKSCNLTPCGEKFYVGKWNTHFRLRETLWEYLYGLYAQDVLA